MPLQVDVVTLGEAMMVFNSPPGVPIERGVAVSPTFAGAESNLAIGLARLGHSVRFLSALGDDVFGRLIAKTLRGEGVDVAQLRLLGETPTGAMFKSRRAWAEPEVLYYRAGSACNRLHAESFDPSAWRDARLLFVTGITPALSQTCRELWTRLIRDAKAHGIPVWLDPNFRGKLWTADEFRKTLLEVLPDVDVILPGVDEGRMLTGAHKPRDIAHLLRQAGAKAVVLKDGANGAFYFGDEEVFVPAFDLPHVVDPIGAGDGFAAGLLSATLDGLAPEAALQRASAVGAMVCLRDGDWEGLPTRAELEGFMSRKGECVR